MAENIAYLKEMLEVPIIDGQSEDVCGQDDRYYAFGMWTDFCGLSNEEMKKAAIANAAGSSECCGGGGGGDTGDTGTTKTENIITLTSRVDQDKYTITATAQKAVDADIVITIPYIILNPDGTTESGQTTLTISNGKKTGTVDIPTDADHAVKVKNGITIEPEETDKYEFTIKNETDPEYNSVMFGTVHYLDMEDYGLDAITYEILKDFGHISLTTRSVELGDERAAEEDPRYHGQPSISDEHAYDFIFLIDADLDIKDLTILDMTGVGEGEVVDVGDSIGFIEYDDEVYAVYRLTNHVAWSVVIGPGEEPVGYEWKYKIQQK